MLIKKHIFLILILLVTANLNAQKTFVLAEMQKPHQVAVDGNDHS